MPLNTTFLKNKKLLAIVLVGIIVIIARIMLGRHPMPPQPPKVVEIEIAKKSEISHEIGLIGTVKPRHYSVLIAKAIGSIDTLIPSGSNVKKGEIIAKIDNTDIEETYELSLSAEKIAKSQFERTESLAKSGASSKGALEDKEKALIEARKALAASKIQLDNINIKAPFDGIIGVYKIKDGEQVSIGEQLVSFYNPDNILIEFDIPSEYISNIQNNQTVFVNENKYSLTHAQKAIDEDKHMCPAYIEIKDNRDYIIGSCVDIKLTIDQSKDNIVIPYSSICIRDGKTSVYIAKDGKAHMKEVTIGIRNKDKIEIKSGIDENEKVIIEGQGRLFDGINVMTTEDLSKMQQSKSNNNSTSNNKSNNSNSNENNTSDKKISNNNSASDNKDTSKNIS